MSGKCNRKRPYRIYIYVSKEELDEIGLRRKCIVGNNSICIKCYSVNAHFAIPFRGRKTGLCQE